MQKKGISPLIATVLIIGFTVALGAVIMTWGSGFVKNMQESTEISAEKQRSCVEDIGLDIKNYDSFGNRVNFVLENTGRAEVKSVVARLSGSAGSQSIPLGGLSAYGISYFYLDTDYEETGALNELELIPSIELNGEEIACSNLFAKKDLDSSRDHLVDVFNTAIDVTKWYVDDVVLTDGEAIITGLTFSSNLRQLDTIPRSNKPFFKADFKSDSLGSGFRIGISDITRANSQRIIMLNDKLYMTTRVAPGGYLDGPDLIDPALADTWYTLEMKVSGSNLKVYVHEKDQPRPSNPQYEFDGMDWDPRFEATIQFAGTGYVDNVVILSD